MTSRMPHPSARLVGALVAALVFMLGLAVVAIDRPFGAGGATITEQPAILMGVLVIVAGLGWTAGRSASSGGWPRAIGVGALAGFAIWPTFMVVAIFSKVVDALIRGTAGPLDGLGAGLIWGLYGAAILGIVGSVVTVPLGVAWGALTRALVRRGSLGSGPRRAWPPVLAGLAAVALVGGAVQAEGAQPGAAACRSIGGGDVVDAAFSPAGDLLAVATLTDPNEPGEIVLLDWPSGEELARWTAWVDEAVAVSPDGDVYWSAWVLGPFPMDDTMISEGVYVARRGAEPEWFASGAETPLKDLTWTTNGLLGTTPNSHQVVLLTAGTTAAGARAGEVGAFWSSPDSRWTATGPAWQGSGVELDGPDGSHAVPVPGDQRSIAFTADRSTLVAASWFNGTRAIDVATGATRLLIGGSQLFIALSSTGDLAWANEEGIGRSQLCTAPFADL